MTRTKRLPQFRQTVISTDGLLFILALAACTPTSAGSQAANTQFSAPADGSDLNVADAAINGGDPTMALSVSQAALSRNPQNVDALYHEGAAYYATGRCMDAIAAYKVALTIEPDSSLAQTGIGRCLLKRNTAEAEQAFAAAVHDDPGNAAALNDLGIARDLQGNYSGAAQPYEQALIIAPGTAAIETNLGLSLALSGDADDAMQYLGPLATGTQATPKIREDYAAALVAAGRLDEARQVLAIDLPPNQINTLVNAFSDLIAQNQQSLSNPAAYAPAAAASDPAAPVYPVAAAPMMPAAPPQQTQISAPLTVPNTLPAAAGPIVEAMQAVAPAPQPVLSLPLPQGTQDLMANGQMER